MTTIVNIEVMENRLYSAGASKIKPILLGVAVHPRRDYTVRISFSLAAKTLSICFMYLS